MYKHVSDFLTDWQYESQSTLSLFRNLDDKFLNKKVHEDVRTLGLLSWHLIHTLQEMPAKMGIHVDIKEQADYNNESVKELCDTYEKAAREVAEEISKKFKDEDLQREDEMYGEKWKRGTTLSILIKHQAHHRAEMVVVMRMLGMKVIGAYGPTREDWAKYGMAAML